MVKDSKNLYMQYGSGYTSNPESWVNFDASPTLFLQRIPLISSFTRRYLRPRFPDNVIFGNILNGLQIEESSCKGIYCSHVLEHLSLEDFRIALRNTNRYLAPNGIFRLVMPDLSFLVEQYNTSSSPCSSIEFMKNSLLGVTKRERSLLEFFRTYIGNSHHLWLWDFKSTESELRKAGFTEIRMAQFGDSNDLRFNEIEDETRWTNCLGIECKKLSTSF